MKRKYQSGGYYTPIGLPAEPSMIVDQEEEMRKAQKMAKRQKAFGIASAAASFIPGVGGGVSALLQQAPNLFYQAGGPLPTGYETGGDLPLASDSFQVKGNPGVPDGNHYGNVALDHNEVVKKNFVFSDILYNPLTGKKFSEEAKALETVTASAEKKADKFNDKISKDTMEMTDRMSSELSQLQEMLAESMGLRNRPQDGLRERPEGMMTGGEMKYQGGGFLPEEGQVFMQVPGLNNEFYDPYQNRMLLRNVDGSYRPLNYSKGKVDNGYLTQGSSRVSIQDHLNKYPYSPQAQSQAQAQAPVRLDAQPADPMLGYDLPQILPPTPKATMPMGDISGVQDYFTNYWENLQGTRERNLPEVTITGKKPNTRAGGKGKPKTPAAALPNLNTGMFGALAGAQAGKPRRPMRPNWITQPLGQAPNNVSSSSLKNAGAAAMTPVPSYGTLPTEKKGFGNVKASDILQAIATGSKFFGIKPEKERAYYDTTPITQEVYDPRAALAQNQQSYQSAVNSIDSPSENLRRAMSSQLFSQRLNTDSNVYSTYDRMNQGARTQFQERVSNQNRYNIGQQTYTDDINARNRGQYRTNLDAAFQSVGEFGKTLGDRETAYDVLRMYKEMYPDVYDRLVKTNRG